MRITAQNVRDIIDIDPASTNLTPFIAAAESLVTRVCVPLLYDAATLALIEAWLAAHFYAIRSRPVQSESVGGASASYQGQTTMNLSATVYGQQAMLLDTEGGLAKVNNTVPLFRKGEVGITHLGDDPADSTDYWGAG